ncbi:MAG: branched chain amino acid aminotransferase [Acidobacteria bacterium]|nr:MAG: branched chain amino acid aminotransferase [Acidobacteriota bacterium]
MAFEGKSEKIWYNGKFVNWDDCKIHIGSHVIHYGSALFGGMRCYKTKHGSAVFRMPDHTKRLIDSCKIYRMDPKYSQQDFNEAILETIRINKMKACYVRPIVYRGYESLGVNPFPCPIDAAIMVWEWGKYLGPGALENGVDVCVSSWNRMMPNTFPAMAKASANYMNSQLIRMEAIVGGFTEGIALDNNGHVSEGSGENIFLIYKGKVWTPHLASSVLSGITRDTVITIAHDLGYEVLEESIPREMLYIADEVFMTGTAAEITPVRSIDKISIGTGKRGPVTERIQNEFFGIISGERPDIHGWLIPVYSSETKMEEVAVAESAK